MPTVLTYKWQKATGYILSTSDLVYNFDFKPPTAISQGVQDRHWAEHLRNNGHSRWKYLPELKGPFLELLPFQLLLFLFPLESSFNDRVVFFNCKWNTGSLNTVWLLAGFAKGPLKAGFKVTEVFKFWRHQQNDPLLVARGNTCGWPWQTAPFRWSRAKCHFEFKMKTTVLKNVQKKCLCQGSLEKLHFHWHLTWYFLGENYKAGSWWETLLEDTWKLWNHNELHIFIHEQQYRLLPGLSDIPFRLKNHSQTCAHTYKCTASVYW